MTQSPLVSSSSGGTASSPDLSIYSIKREQDSNYTLDCSFIVVLTLYLWSGYQSWRQVAISAICLVYFMFKLSITAEDTVTSTVERGVRIDKMRAFLLPIPFLPASSIFRRMTYSFHGTIPNGVIDDILMREKSGEPGSYELVIYLTDEAVARGNRKDQVLFSSFEISFDELDKIRTGIYYTTLPDMSSFFRI